MEGERSSEFGNFNKVIMKVAITNIIQICNLIYYNFFQESDFMFWWDSLKYCSVIITNESFLTWDGDTLRNECE